MDLSNMKKCIRCENYKSIDEFSVSSSRKDGRNPYCKKCISEKYNQRKHLISDKRKEYYQRNKEKISNKAKLNYIENSEKIKNRTKKYKEENREKYLEYLRVYYRNNKNYYKEYAVRNQEKIRIRNSLYRKNNYEKLIVVEQSYRETNRELLAKKAREWYSKNRQRAIKRLKQYRDFKPDVFLSLNAKRRARKLNATPKWLTKEDFKTIEELYICSKMFKLYTGQEYHVDHIIPLNGKTVCGLHVPWNLQIITAEENLSKSNKYLVE